MPLATWTFIQPRNCINQDILHLVHRIVNQKKLFKALHKASKETLVFTFLISTDSITVTVDCYHKNINNSSTFTFDNYTGFTTVLDYVYGIVEQITFELAKVNHHGRYR